MTTVIEDFRQQHKTMAKTLDKDNKDKDKYNNTRTKKDRDNKHAMTKRKS